MGYEVFMNEYNKIGYSKDGIVQVKSFMNQSDANRLVGYLSSFDKSGNIYQNEIDNTYVKMVMNMYQRMVFEEIKHNYIDRYGVSVKEEPLIPVHFTKWDMLIGESMPLHSDSETPSGKPAIAGGFYRYNITSIVYLSDDFVGGEIQFPEFDLSIKPGVGDLLLFPSRYRHSIAKFFEGTRYTMPAWFTFDVVDDIPGKEAPKDSNPSDVLFFENSDV